MGLQWMKSHSLSTSGIKTGISVLTSNVSWFFRTVLSFIRLYLYLLLQAIDTVQLKGLFFNDIFYTFPLRRGKIGLYPSRGFTRVGGAVTLLGHV